MHIGVLRKRKKRRNAYACFTAIFPVCAFFLFFCFFAISPERKCGVLQRYDVRAEAVTGNADPVDPDDGKQTDRFDDPFGNFEDMPPEDLDADFSGGENGAAENNGFYYATAALALCAAGALAIILYVRRKKRNQEQMTEMKQHAALAAANEFIKKDPVFFADFADMLRLFRYRLCYAAEDGILMQDTSGYYKDGTYLFAAKDEIAAEKILLACPEEHENMRNGTVSCHGEKIAAALRAFFGYDRITTCYQVVYAPEKPLPLKGVLRFEKANEKHLQTILDTYDRESPEVLKKLVASGRIYCAYAPADLSGEAENFIGYIGQHPEGSMGLLLIFPQYRRHGYAEELESFQINAILAEGRTPYAHIIEDNFKSFSLQQKLGAIVASGKVVWMSRSDEKRD